MMNMNHWKVSLTTLALLVGAVGISHNALAHCDSMDGPVVKAARAALSEENVNLVLIWVQQDDDEVIKNAFERTLAVRKLNPDARELADLYFFETLVRVHRAGEGVAYTGLKPSGTDFGPSIPATDRALEAEDVEPVLQLISSKTEPGVRERFQKVMAKKKAKELNKNDVQAGREFVKAYVEYTHYAKRIHDAAARAAVGHFPEVADAAPHAHPGKQ